MTDVRELSTGPGHPVRLTRAMWSRLPNSSTARATGQLVVGSVGAQVLVALTFGLVARELGRSTFGLLVVLFGIAAIAQDCLDFGTSLWLTRELAAGRIAGTAAVGVLRRRSALALAIGSVIALVATAVGVPWPLALSLLVYVVGALTNGGVYVRLRAAGLFRRVSILGAAERAVWLILVCGIVVARPERTTAVGLVVGAMGCVYFGTTRFGLPREAAAADDKRPTLRSVYRRAASFGVIGLSSDLQQLDATLVAPLAGLTAAAEVGIASKLTGPLTFTAGSITQVAFRTVAVGDDDSSAGARFAVRLATCFGLAVAALAPALPTIVVLLLGQDYRHARVAVFVYALGAAVSVVNQPLSAVLSAAGKERAVSRVVLVSVVTGLVIGTVAASSLGAAGMGLGYVVTQLAIASICWIRYKRDGLG